MALGRSIGWTQRTLPGPARICKRSRPVPVHPRLLQAVQQTESSCTVLSAADASATGLGADATRAEDTVADVSAASALTESAARVPRALTPDELPADFAQLSQSHSSTVCTSTGKFLEASICRLYYYNDDQKAIIQDLVNSMRNSRSALTVLAAANVLLSIVNASDVGPWPFGGAAPATLLFGGITVGDVAYWGDSLMVAALINYASRPFERVLCSRSNQMAYTFQGLNRLSLVFQQLSIGSAAVSVVTGLEAAAEYPPVVLWASGAFVGLAVLRSAAMWWTLSRHAQNNEEVSKTLMMMREPGGAGKDMSLLDRMATFLAFGYLLQFEQKTPSPEPALAASGAVSAPDMAAIQPTSLSLLRGDTIAAHTDPAGLNPTSAVPRRTPALDLQRATLTSSVSSEESSNSSSNGSGTDEPGLEQGDQAGYEFNEFQERVLRGLTETASTAGLAMGLQAFMTFILGENGVNKAIMTYLLFSACSSYDRALHTDGTDVKHLMDGLGKKGLTGLFYSLAVLSWTIAVAQLLTLALPWITESLLAKAAGDGVSTRVAEGIIKSLQWVRAILRGI